MIDPDDPVTPTRIDVLSSGTLDRAKVTPDQGREDVVSAVGHDGAVERVGLVPRFTVVAAPARGQVHTCQPAELLRCKNVLGEYSPVIPIATQPVSRFGVRGRLVDLVPTPHPAEIPQPHRLVFPVRNDVTAVALGVDIGQTLGMARQHARGDGRSDRSAVPKRGRMGGGQSKRSTTRRDEKRLLTRL